MPYGLVSAMVGLMVAGVLLAGCSAAAAPAAAPTSTTAVAGPTAADTPLPIPAKTYTESDTSIQVKAGDEFGIRLDSNPTTGYRWQLANPLDESTLALLGSDYRPGGSPGLVGAGGEEIWVFRAVAPGKATISMEYVRPWEKGVAPAKEYSVEVVVMDGAPSRPSPAAR